MSKYVYADGAIHHDHHKEFTLNISGKTDVIALMREMMRDDVEDVVEVEEEIKNSISENTIQEKQEVINPHKKNDCKQEYSSLEIPKSVKACFRIANNYVREQVEAIVNDFYLGQAVNLAMIEIALFDHGQLQKRNEHTAFVRALRDWGILPEDIDIAKTARGMASKLRKPFPTEGYKKWKKYYVNERNLCTNIGNRLPESMKYNRNE